MPQPEKGALRAGVYRHYKGDHYLVIGVARDDGYEGDDRLLVVYSRLYPRDGVPLCARPIDEFCDSVVTDEDGPVARFTYLGYADKTDLDDPVVKEAK
jgi:hypothetical protein